jgi:hypothetical protein
MVLFLSKEEKKILRQDNISSIYHSTEMNGSETQQQHTTPLRGNVK